MAGVPWVLFAGLMFSINAVCVRFGGHTLPVAELVFYRFTIGGIVLTFIMYARGISWQSTQKKRLFYRGTSGMLSATTYYLALLHLPLATASTLSNTTGLFLAILGLLFLKARLKPTTLGSLILGLIGICLVLRADFHKLHTVGAIAALSNGLFSALSYFNIRELNQAGEPDERIISYFFLTSILYSGLWVLSQGGLHPLSLRTLPYLLGLGISGLLAQWGITRAYSRGEAGITSVFSYFGTLFFIFWDWWLWSIHLSLWMFIGIICIAVSGIWVSKR